MKYVQRFQHIFTFCNFICLPLFPCLFISESIFLSMSPSVCLCLSFLSLCVSLCVYRFVLSLSRPPCITLFLSLCLFLYPSVFLCMFVVCFSVTLLLPAFWLLSPSPSLVSTLCILGFYRCLCLPTFAFSLSVCVFFSISLPLSL